MAHLLNDDCILQIAQELVSLKTIQENRYLYNLASHCLLYCPTDNACPSLRLGLEGDTSSDRRIEGFRDFVLEVTSRRSRVRHLRQLIFTGSHKHVSGKY